jgi:hypothetical protein
MMLIEKKVLRKNILNKLSQKLLFNILHLNYITMIIKETAGVIPIYQIGKDNYYLIVQ